MLGTAHLDEMFKNASLNFIMSFGSLVTVIGNPRHANYRASNTFR